jgi:hypothetical protein
MTVFGRRALPPRDRNSYPQPGYVAVVSAETQEWEFVSAKAIRSHGHLPVLGAEEAEWLGQAEQAKLLDELTVLANAAVSPEDRLDILRAAALVRYALETGTAIQVVPPAS